MIRTARYRHSNWLAQNARIGKSAKPVQPEAEERIRRVGARLSQAPDVAGYVAIPSYSPADSKSAGLCIAAYVENSLFCR